MPHESDEPPSTDTRIADNRKTEEKSANGNGQSNIISRIKTLVSGKSDNGLRETIEEFMDVQENEEGDPIAQHERVLLLNILKLRDVSVFDVMIPRADIFAIEVGTTQKELLRLLAEKQFSRIPVYKENLDNVLGTIHLKDILAALANNKKINIESLITEIPIVSPAMTLLDLVMEMRKHSRHMALVVDEYGGIDGLVTIGDVLEAIVGQIEDEHDTDNEPQMEKIADGSVVADARLDIDNFEEQFGPVFTEEEREESDTLGGVVSFIAGRVPARGEILTHDTGMVFEVLDADPRRVNLLKIRKIPNA